MTHLREEERRGRHRLSYCRKGDHNYGETQNIGAGITRRVCLTCSAVSIDLSQADEPREPVVQGQRTIASLSQDGS